MAIRYDKQLNSEIRRTVANFNRKVSRLESQQRELIPNKVYTADLKEQYTSRRELKRKLAELQRFSERGVEEVITTEAGLRMSKWDIDNLKREIRRSNYRLNREMRRLEKQITPLTITRKAAYNTLKKRSEVINRDIFKINKSQLKTLKANVARTLDYDHKSEQFYTNFFQMLFSEAGFSGVSQEVLDNIYNKLSRLTPDQLLKLAREDGAMQAIIDYSPTKGNAMSASRMRDILTSINDRLPQILGSFEG